MKQTSLLTVLTLSTILSACAGGGGGGVNIPTTTLLSASQSNARVTGMSTSVMGTAPSPAPAPNPGGRMAMMAPKALEQEFNLDNVQQNLVKTFEGEQDTYISFKVDEDKKITGIVMETNQNSASKMDYVLDRNGDTNVFAKTQTIYRYGVNMKNGYSGTEFVSNNPNLTLSEVKNLLIQRVDELDKYGVYSGNDVNELKDFINAATDLSDFSQGVQNDGEDIPEGTRFKLYSNNAKIVEVAEYNSYGKDMKLAYSDFGSLNVTTKEGTQDSYNEIKVFAGGYEAKKIDPTKMSGEMSFKGRAIGGVNSYDGVNGSGRDGLTSKNLGLDGTANLVFNDGKQTLNALFSNWYDVEVIKEDGQKDKISFSNGDKIDDADFKFRGQDTYDVEDFTRHKQVFADGNTPTEAPDMSSGVVGDSYGGLAIGYYGDGLTPNEATGYVMYGESLPYESIKDSDNYDKIKALDVQFGFGAKKQ